MRENRQSGSEGGAAQTNAPSLPLSNCSRHPPVASCSIASFVGNPIAIGTTKSAMEA